MSRRPRPSQRFNNGKVSPAPSSRRTDRGRFGARRWNKRANVDSRRWNHMLNKEHVVGKQRAGPLGDRDAINSKSFQSESYSTFVRVLLIRRLLHIPDALDEEMIHMCTFSPSPYKQGGPDGAKSPVPLLITPWSHENGEITRA